MQLDGGEAEVKICSDIARFPIPARTPFPLTEESWDGDKIKMSAPRQKQKQQKTAQYPKQPPLWLRRLDLVKAELKTVRFPRTAAEGFRQCAMLSETARRWFLDSIRQEHPGWSEVQIEHERRLIFAR
jgi:hypothetical protein